MNPFSQEENKFSQDNDLFALEEYEHWESMSRNLQPKTNRNQTNPVTISTVSCSNDTMVIATSLGSVIRCNTRGSGKKEFDEIDISNEKDPIKRVFVDPSGHHILACLSSGVVYYIHSRSNKPKKVSTLSNLSVGSGSSAAKHAIECLCFDRLQTTEQSTKSFLVGTNQGAIFEVSSLEGIANERRVSVSGNSSLSPPCQLLVQLPDVSSPISEVFCRGGGSVKGQGTALNVLFATAQPTRIYHYANNNRVIIGANPFQQLFAGMQWANRFIELPSAAEGEVTSSIVTLKCYSPPTSSSSLSPSSSSASSATFALLTDLGIYHGDTSVADLADPYSSLPLQLQPTLLPLLPTTALIPSSRPLSLVLTEYHFLVLYADRVQVLSRLDGQMVQELPVPRTQVHGSSVSTVRAALVLPQLLVDDTSSGGGNSIWLHTPSMIFRLVPRNEGRHTWRLLLEKAVRQGGDEELFEQALSHCLLPGQREQVMLSRAEIYMQGVDGEGDVNPSREDRQRAAICYAQCGKEIAFEEVVLRLLRYDTNSSSIKGGNGNRSNNNNSNSKSSSNSSGGGSSGITREGVILGESLSALSYQQLNPLRLYLTALLTNDKKDRRGQVRQIVSPKSQRTMLCTWICDIYLHQITASTLLDTTGQPLNPSTNTAMFDGNGDGEAVPHRELVAQFENFLRVNRSTLDFSTTLSLLCSRAHRPLLLFYTRILGDYQRVVGMLITERRFMEAISVLQDAPFEKVASLVYKNAPIFMENEPEATVEMLLSKHRVPPGEEGMCYLNQPQLKVAEVLPAILRYTHLLDTALSSQAMTQRNMNGQEQGLAQGPEANPTLHRLNTDFDGNEVNFAIVFLKEILAVYSITYGAATTRYEQPQPSVPFEGFHPVIIHTMVWLLAKYEKDVPPVGAVMGIGVGDQEGGAIEGDRWIEEQVEILRGERELYSLLSRMHRLAKGEGDDGQLEGDYYGTSTVQDHLNSFNSHVEVDYSYVLRLCRQYNKPCSSVLALLLLDQPTQAVEEALAIGLSFAKQIVHRLMQLDCIQSGDLLIGQVVGVGGGQIHANSIGEETKIEDQMVLATKRAKKNIWLQLARHVIAESSQKGVGEAIALIKDSENELSIDDLLPHLPNFTEIDLFKDEICQTLEICGSKILSLKAAMEFLSEAADSTLKELEGMKRRPYMLSGPSQQCDFCSSPLLSSDGDSQAESFYLFPCSHGYHTRCLLQRAPVHLDADQLQVVRGLQKLLAEAGVDLHNGSKDGRDGQSKDHRSRARVEALQAELDGYIAADCPLCGYAMVRLVGRSLISEEDRDEALSWEL